MSEPASVSDSLDSQLKSFDNRFNKLLGIGTSLLAVLCFLTLLNLFSSILFSAIMTDLPYQLNLLTAAYFVFLFWLLLISSAFVVVEILTLNGISSDRSKSLEWIHSTFSKLQPKGTRLDAHLATLYSLQNQNIKADEMYSRISPRIQKIVNNPTMSLLSGESSSKFAWVYVTGLGKFWEGYLNYLRRNNRNNEAEQTEAKLKKVSLKNVRLFAIASIIFFTGLTIFVLDLNQGFPYLQQARIDYKQKNYQDAVDMYNKMLSKCISFSLIPTSHAQLLDERGNAYYMLEKYKESIDDYTKAIKLAPGSACYYSHRGNAYDRLGQYQRAIDDDTKAVSHDAKYYSAYHGREQAYNALGDYQKALKDCNTMIQCYPESANAYVNRAYEFYQLGQYYKTIKDCNIAISISPDNENPYIGRECAYIELGMYSQAIENCNIAIKLNSKSWGNYYDRASIYNKIGQYQKAIDDCNIAIKLAPDADYIHVAYNMLGHAYNAQGQHQQADGNYVLAYRLCNRAIKHYPNNGHAFEDLAYACNRLGHYQNAIDNCNIAIRLSPKDHFIYTTYIERGFAYDALGQHKLAANDFDIAAKLNSEGTKDYQQRNAIINKI